MENRCSDIAWDVYTNHKGSWCHYKNQFCQENLGCNRCQIYLDLKEKPCDSRQSYMMKCHVTWLAKSGKYGVNCVGKEGSWDATEIR